MDFPDKENVLIFMWNLMEEIKKVVNQSHPHGLHCGHRYDPGAIQWVAPFIKYIKQLITKDLITKICDETKLHVDQIILVYPSLYL